ncbi:DUF1643 domain-containing protein [Arcobacter lacus]|uniref:DUF1643 domain-containing protein n=1 Tax=Arcobacter lacus TaxID=1912876 RepID=A0ABX5JIU2_9BACT|nr:DUF1643 domain-containing protein [Arcobacter lacus]PUE67166.1 hypothetical protein B0175_03050 [Arcobacter lacus]
MIKVTATFTQLEDYSFRYNTKMFFGDTYSTCLGTVFMLNPGSALPIDKDVFISENITVNNIEVHLDQTMHSVKNMIYFHYGQNVNGFFNIINLFNLRNENLKEAIITLNKIKNNSEVKKFLFYDIQKLNKIVLESPFIWLAWGTKLTTELEDIIEENYEMLSKKAVFIPLKNDFPYIKHPLYMTKKQREYLKDTIENLLV